MDFDKYKMTRPYPPAPDYPLLPTNPTPEDYRKHADAKEAHLQAIEVWKKERSDWEAEENRLFKGFKADALAEVGLENHPKADKAYGLAWKNGHSSGLSEVYSYLLDYAELLKD
jgi:hypothetical protein